MTVTFPLAIGMLADFLPISSVAWNLSDQQQYSRTGGGEILAKDLGPRLWTAKVTLTPTSNLDVGVIEGLLDTLDGAINEFYLFDPRRRYPVSDPKGTILAGSAGVYIDSLGSDNKSLSLRGLPADYVIPGGTMIAFDYGDLPRRALHRFSIGGVANGDGETGLLELRPHIRPGATVNTQVALAKASAKVKILPGSLASQPGPDVNFTNISFSVLQTLSPRALTAEDGGLFNAPALNVQFVAYVPVTPTIITAPIQLFEVQSFAPIWFSLSQIQAPEDLVEVVDYAPTIFATSQILAPDTLVEVIEYAPNVFSESLISVPASTVEVVEFSPVWWQPNAVYSADLRNGRYMRDLVEISEGATITVARASGHDDYAPDVNGDFVAFAPNTLRRTDAGILGAQDVGE